jgi:hypothetical protein
MDDDTGEWRFTEETPGLFSVLDLTEVESIIRESIRVIHSYDSPRLIVLESWFIIDWLIRQIILTGIEATQYRSEEFLPHYQLLPRSFQECLEALKNLIIDQRRLPVQPPKDQQSRLTGSYQLWVFIRDEYPEVFKGIREAEKAFLRKKFGVQTQNGMFVDGYGIDSLFEKKIDRKYYRAVSKAWLNSVSRIDEEWFKKAEKLNKARNAAAHSVSSERIYTIFGIAGPWNLDLLREMCIGILAGLAGLKQEKE